jgi:hypothetical protein
MNINESRKLTDTESKKRDEILKGMMSNKKSFINRYGHRRAEEVMLKRATKMAKKQTTDNMSNVNLKELVHQALMNPTTENKRPDYPDLDGDGDTKEPMAKALKDKKLKEDFDIGHEDNEPNALQSDLMQIANDAIELYQIINSTEGHGEVDFPSWFQSKIIRSKEALQSATQYLNFEKNEPSMDAIVGDELPAQPTALSEADGNLLDFKKKPRALVGLIGAFVKYAEMNNKTFMVEDTVDEFLGIYATDTFEDEIFGDISIENVSQVLYRFTQYNHKMVSTVSKHLELVVLNFIKYLYGDKPVKKADQPDTKPNRGFSMNETLAGSIAKNLKNR